MAATPYNLQIVTPDGETFAGEVVSAVLPGVDGSFGILAHHAPLVSALTVGILQLRDAAGKLNLMAIGEGFAEVVPEGVKVLTDFVERPEDIDVPRAEAARQRAKQRLDQKGVHDIDHIRAEASLRRALLRLRAAGTPRI